MSALLRSLHGGQASTAIADDVTVHEYLKPLRAFLDADGVTEVCVNRPGEVFVERATGWERHDVPKLTFNHLQSLATAVATLTGQHTSEANPLLGAKLPSGERIQFVQPVATETGIFVVCIRKPSMVARRLSDFAESGVFRHLREVSNELYPFEHELLELKASGRYEEFLAKAVHHHQTIVVAGKTGSGKTTFMKALVEEIPADERLITIEDAAEITLPTHKNKVHLFFSKNGQGSSLVSPKQLLEACLRLRPDRILLAEVRGEEAYYFLRLAASGHPGSLTSIHAGSCSLAFEQLALMVRESTGGAGMTIPEIRQLARDVVNIVVHFDKDARGRFITGIHYDPMARLRTHVGSGDAALGGAL